MIKKQILVSIIVPIYNVEKYLTKCIESILNQKYRNIELILVDDGTPDSSGEICDSYGNKDKRVKVIHQDNEGVSSARNKGIDNASGDYIVFVDADDFLADDYIEYMLTLVEKTESDFCISKNCYKFQTDLQEANDRIEKLLPKESTALLLSQELEVGCWNKIYNKKLLDDNNIRFKTSQFYGEGLEFIIAVSQASKYTGVGLKKVYYYRQNNINSATKKFNYKKYINGEESLNIIKNNLKIIDEKINEQLNIHYCLFYCNAVLDTLYNKKKKEYKASYYYWMENVKKLAGKVLFYKKTTFKQKLEIVAVIICPQIIVARRKIKEKIKSKKSVN